MVEYHLAFHFGMLVEGPGIGKKTGLLTGLRLDHCFPPLSAYRGWVVGSAALNWVMGLVTLDWWVSPPGQYL